MALEKLRVLDYHVYFARAFNYVNVENYRMLNKLLLNHG